MSIEIRDIRKSFGTFRALDGVSLDMPKGKMTALLGPSGCGKTTLLRVIAGLETADNGTIRLAGEDATDKHVRERRVGFVFQHYALFRHMTVFENVAFGLRVKPRHIRLDEREIRAKVEKLLDLVQLKWLQNRFPSQLSGGQRQRIALARALAVEPEVLLLDEPFGALDAKVRKELRRWLRQLHDELHITSIFVTHDQEEALEVADRVVLMNKGRVEQVAHPGEIYTRPATSFACSFIGNVNRFRGRIEDGFLRVGNDRLPLPSSNIADGASVVAYARPHDMHIDTESTETVGVGAKVNRILPAGSAVRVELVAPTLQGGHPEYFEVELPAGDLSALGLRAGQNVRLSSDRLSIFEE